MIPKVRAWHKKYKRMYEVLHLHLDLKAYDDKPWVTCLGFDAIEQKDIHIKVMGKDCVILQSTGLKDKNSVEIFEGDVVRLWHNMNNDKGDTLAIITWDSRYTRWKPEHIKDRKYSSGNLGSYPQLEVIGNIHENPELLEAK